MSCGDTAEVVAWLTRRSERVIETACAWVFLAGDTALKLKRPVDFGYVDFTTVERRLWALERELAFNRRAAPDIYRRVLRVTRDAEGGLALEGSGRTVDHLLEMRRFPDDAVLAARPERLDGEMAEALGRAIARFHVEAELRPEGGWPGVAFTVRSNASLLRKISGLKAGEVEALIAATDAEFARQAARLKARGAAGYARRCHGDLHLGNILVEQAEPVLFDCLEFNDLLSDIDVLYDLAFLLMDLGVRGRAGAAVRVLSGYLDEAARRFPADLWDGLAALPLLLSVRSAIRAHVQAHAGDFAGAQRYLTAAREHLAPPSPVLAAVGGLSGSGKSTWARTLAPQLGSAPGAVILRTDEVRKRLMDVPATHRLGPDAYTDEVSQRTHDELFANASALLKAGRAVVLDATFIDPAIRARAEALATECGVTFQPVWLDAPLEVLEARIAARTHDASDATVAVLHAQVANFDIASVTWPRLDAGATGA